MVFKTVDGNITNIFKSVDLLKTKIDLSTNSVNRYVEAFANINSKQNFGKGWTNFLAGMESKDSNVSLYFRELAEKGASAKASVEGVYEAILSGNTRGLANVKSTMALFNQAQKSGSDNARDFAKAVGQSNTQLGGYLSTLGTNGTATLKGYTGYLVSATAKTIGLQLVTAALNVGISLALNAIVWGITKVVNQMSELQDKIDDLKSDLDDTKSKIEDINSTLDKNKEKIKELNSEPLSITDKETLSTLQLENAELERQKKLLEEIEKQKAKALNDTTAEYLNKKSKLNVDDGYWKSVWNNFVNRDSFVDDFNQIFDKNTTWGEKILNISKFVAPSLGNVVDTFIPETRSILDETKSFKDELDKNIEEINKIIGDGSPDKIDYQAFANVMGDVNDLRGELSANIETLSTYRDSLSKTSKEYQTISGYINDYTNQLANLEKFDEYNIDGFTDNYFKIKDEFDKGLNGYLTSIHDNQNIDESILESLGTKFDETGRQFYALTGNYMEQFRQAEQLLKTFDNIELNRGLTYDESVIKSSVQLFYNTLSEEIEKYGEDYSNGKSSEAANIFNKYVDNYPIKDITKETYDEWRDGLLEQAQGDTEIKNDLIRMANGISLDIAKSIENKPFETTTQSLTELQEAIDNAFGNQSTIQSAFDKIQKGSSLSVDEVRKLVELCPKLASEFIKTSDGYTIGADKLIQANDDMLKSTKKSLQERADYLKKFLNTDYDTSKINGSYEAQKYSEWKQSITEAESELESLNLILTMFGLTTEDSTDKIEDLSKSTSNLVSKAKTLSSAFKEQNENGKLSEDTVLSLIENGYAAALMYDNKTGAIRLNTQAYLDLANAEIQQQITEIEIAKNDAMQDKLNAEHEMVANLGWSYLDTAEAALRYQSTIDRISNAEADISAYEAQINMLESLKNALGQVTGGTYGGSGTSNSKPQSILNFEKELAEKEHEIAMGQREENEDYYSWLLSAAHTAYDGLADYQDDLWKYEEEVYKGRKQLADDFYDEQQKDFEDRISNLENDIEIATNYSTDSDGNKLNVEEKYDYISSAYQEIINEFNSRIGKILDTGIEGHEEDVAKLEQQIIEYQEKLAELPKTAAEEEQTYIKKLKDDYSDLYDERMKKIKEQQDAAEKAAQAEIDAVQEKIDALKDANDKEQEALDIEKARKELEKASQSTRQVYGSDGSISFKADDEKVKEAQENLDKLMQEKQINILEKQKQALEDVKTKESEAYDSIIDNLETEKENSEKRFDILLDVLDKYLNPDQGESNSDVWKMLAHLEGATYKNGVWTDKDGKAIDIDKLVNTVETAKKEDNLGVGKKPDDTRDALKGSLRKDNNKDDVIRGHLTRQNIGNETSDVKDVADTTGSVVESFFSNLEKKLGLKDGSLSLDKVSDVLNGSNKMGYNPYAAMTERVGTVGSEYANANNVNNNNAANITIGDIVINNPVGNSDDLAKELRANLHNAADKIIYSNLR